MRIKHALAVSALNALGTLFWLVSIFFPRELCSEGELQRSRHGAGVSIFFFRERCSEGEARELSSEPVVSSCFLRVVLYSRSSV
jgi:hypothetical protein